MLHTIQKYQNSNNNKIFPPSDRFIVAYNILGHPLYKGSNFFSQCEAHGNQNTQNFK
jgi:hypothetical protein